MNQEVLNEFEELVGLLGAAHQVELLLASRAEQTSSGRLGRMLAGGGALEGSIQAVDYLVLIKETGTW